jgi:hypothetical protein
VSIIEAVTGGFVGGAIALSGQVLSDRLLTRRESRADAKVHAAELQEHLDLARQGVNRMASARTLSEGLAAMVPLLESINAGHTCATRLRDRAIEAPRVL